MASHLPHNSDMQKKNWRKYDMFQEENQEKNLTYSSLWRAICHNNDLQWKNQRKYDQEKLPRKKLDL